jgi:hypothetical protein
LFATVLRSVVNDDKVWLTNAKIRGADPTGWGRVAGSKNSGISAYFISKLLCLFPVNLIGFCIGKAVTTVYNNG